MGARRIRREQRQFDMALSRRTNGLVKQQERLRRKKRMLEIIKASGNLPYTPVVMSWLSVELDKPSGRITQDEVDQVVKQN
jgi:hypothetical protein